MKAVKLSDNIFWVGGVDWDLRNFHGYVTQKGSTYNAYLIVDEKVVLIDTVKHYLKDEMLKRISTIIDPKKIDYIISNHVEKDHSGSIPALMEICPNAVILTSPNGEKGLKMHYKGDYKYQVMNSGDSFSTGKKTLQFVLTPMVHWPDNMVTYCPEDKILFSNDAFGQHIASYERFDDEYPIETILDEAKKYYANIVLPFGAQVQKALEQASKLDISMIAPSHGIIWRKHLDKILPLYNNWSKNNASEKAVIIFDSMWGSTTKIAEAIADAFECQDISFTLLDLQHNHISDIMTLLIDSRYICVGSPTLNNNMLPTVAAFLTYLKGLAPKNRIALAFGSYGWGGQSIQQVNDVLASCGFSMLESIKVNYVPDVKQLEDISKNVELAIAK